jgi:hypothetical protein
LSRGRPNTDTPPSSGCHVDVGRMPSLAPRCHAMCRMSSTNSRLELYVRVNKFARWQEYSSSDKDRATRMHATAVAAGDTGVAAAQHRVGDDVTRESCPSAKLWLRARCLVLAGHGMIGVFLLVRPHRKRPIRPCLSCQLRTDAEKGLDPCNAGLRRVDAPAAITWWLWCDPPQAPTQMRRRGAFALPLSSVRPSRSLPPAAGSVSGSGTGPVKPVLVQYGFFFWTERVVQFCVAKKEHGPELVGSCSYQDGKMRCARASLA